MAVGRAVPTGAYHAAASGQGFNSGWQGIALVEVALPGWPVALRADGDYGTHQANERLKTDLTAALGQPSDEQTQLLGGTVGLVYPMDLAFPVQPYAFGGIGAHHVNVALTSGDSTAEISETRFAWSLGAGMVYRIRGPAPFLEARYVNVSAVTGFPKTTFFSVVAGLRLPGR